MAQTNLAAANTTALATNQTDYSVSTKNTDGPGDQDETEWINTNWSKWFGYYKTIPELKKAIDAYATWVIGKGFDLILSDDQATADIISGWGEDTLNSLLWNMIVVKKIGGDAYAHIIRDEESGQIINFKPLDPASIRHIVDRSGVLKRYEQISKSKAIIRKFEPEEILHLCNDRVADEIHGVSVVEACENVILNRNEAMADWKTVLHRNINPLKIVEIDSDDTATINNFITKWETTVKDKEVIFVPKGNVQVTIPPVTLQDPLATIKYYENFFYQSVGIPKIILGGSEEFTEASSKIAYLTFEQTYAREQEELQIDFERQTGIQIKIRMPVSLKNELLSSEDKNTGQTGFQPNATTAGSGQ